EVEYGIVDVARVSAHKPACPHGQSIRKGYVDRSVYTVAHLTGILHVIELCLYTATEALSGGINSDELDQPTHATCAIEGALRTAQDFNPRQIARVNFRNAARMPDCVSRTERCIIYDDADSRIHHSGP